MEGVEEQKGKMKKARTGEGPTLPAAVRKYLEAANLPALEELKTIVATQCNKMKVIEELLQKAKEVGLTITIKSRGGR